MCYKYSHPNQPELYAREIIDGFEIFPPIRVNSICGYFNIDILNDNLKSAEAFLLVGSGIKKIILNNANILYETRKRFTIAHELGHYFIPWHSNFYKCSSKDISIFNSKNPIENEANQFAAELLMPLNQIERDINNNEINIELIKHLSNRYDVSLTAMAMRLIKISNEPIAIVFYYKNGHKKIFKSLNFLWDIKDGRLNNSYADKLLNDDNQSARQYCGIVDAGVWIEDADVNKKLLEESLYMPNFNRVFTFLKYDARNNDIFEFDDI